MMLSLNIYVNNWKKLPNLNFYKKGKHASNKKAPTIKS